MKVATQRLVPAARWLLLAGVACLWTSAAAIVQGFTTTTVQGTVYLANGKPGAGILQLSWPAFTTANNQAVAAGRTNVTIGGDGYVSVNLAPNLGSTPAGLYYTAVYHLSDGTTSTEYWVVPAAAQANLSQVRAQVMPAAQAVQAVSKAYVDQSITELTQSLLTSSGGSLSGPLFLNGDPTQPAQAATKRYVDTEFANALPAGGGAASGPLTSVQLGAAYQVDQFPGADFGARLQACLNRLDAVYGGTCDARNFTATQGVGSPVVVSTANATVQLPCATIATQNAIRIAPGTRNVTFHGCALRGASDASGSQGGTVFLYSGTGPMIQVGDPAYAVNTLGFHIDNVVINTTAATDASAQGLTAYRTQEMDLEGLYLLGNSNQTGMTLDGTGNYTGGTFQDIQFGGFGTALNAIGHQVTNGANTDWVNASSFVRLHINCPTSNGSATAGTYGINLAQGDGNTFTGGDVEGCGTALHLGPNAQNNTIVGLRNENSISQVVADAGSSYNNWITGGTMFTGQLTDNGTRNSFLDTFHRSFNGLNGDWYGSQKDATVTNHFRIGTGTGNERGLLDRYQTDYGYRWTTGLTDAAGGQQYYQILDELNNVNRLSIGQYNHGQAGTNNQTVINAAGTGAVILNGSANSGTGGVLFGSGGSTGATVAAVNNAGNAQFNGTLQVGGASTFVNSTTVKNQADAEIDSILWAGASANQKESFIYKDYLGASQWYMVKDASNNWALNSAVGGLDSFKAYQSNNSGDTYINASNGNGHIRLNYESGAGKETDIYSGPGGTLVAAFLGSNSIKFPGLASSIGRNCLQIDNSGYISNTGTPCGSGDGGGVNGTVSAGSAGQVAYYAGDGTVIAGTSSVTVGAGGTGATTAPQALQNLGAQAALPGVASDGASGIAVNGNIAAATAVAGSVNGVYDLKAKFGAPGFGSSATMTCTATSGSANLTGCTGNTDFSVGSTVYIQAAGVAPNISTPGAPTVACTAVNGGSCTGSVVYGYRIAAIQGQPNGAMTALGPEITITQSAQGALKRPNGGGAYAYTTVSWAAVSNATRYAVYKSVNGGTSTFYQIVEGTSFNDNGHPSMGGGTLFTCVDIAIPCSAPAGVTPNDVYAKITAVSGGTVTLGALSLVPRHWTNGPEGAFYPSVPGISGAVTVQHDDTPAFTAAYVALQSTDINNPTATLHMPSATLHIHNADPWGYASGGLRLNNLYNVNIEGEGHSTLLVHSNDRAGANGMFLLGQCGGGTDHLPLAACTSWVGNLPGAQTAPGYNLTDPINKGDVKITLATPSDSSHFTEGQYVSIYIPAADNTYPANMYGELNQVVAVNSTTGVLTLAYPATKMYSATLTPPYSACTNCNLAARIGPVNPRPSARNVVLRNFDYSGYNMFLNYSGVDGITLENLTLRVHMLETEGFSRHQIIRNNTIYDADRGRLIVEAADASADVVAEGNHYIDSAFQSVGQPCSEGSANVRITNNTFELSGNTYDDVLTGIMGGDLCYGFDLSQNKIDVNKASVTFIFGLTGYTSGQIRGNVIHVDADSLQGAAINSSGPYTTVTGNTWQSESGIPIAKAYNNTDVQNLSNYTTAAQSGGIQIYSTYGSQTLTTIPMSGNITSINLGGTRIAGYYFALNFVQAASGGPYTLPSDCTGAKWGTGGNLLDCPNGVPKANPTASSSTIIWFYDDGATVHVVSSSYQPTGALADWSNAGASANYVATCTAVSGGSCTAWSPQPASSSGGSVVANLDRTGLTANLGNTTVYTVPTGKAGWYRVSCYEVITTAGVGSSTLPQCAVLGTDEETGVSINGKTFVNGLYIGTSNTRNLVGAVNGDGGSQSSVFRAPAGSAITVNTGTGGAYSPGSGTPMVYSIHVVVEYLGP